MSVVTAITRTWRIFMTCFQKLKVGGLAVKFIVLYNVYVYLVEDFYFSSGVHFLWCVHKAWNDIERVCLSYLRSYICPTELSSHLNVYTFITPAYPTQ